MERKASLYNIRQQVEIFLHQLPSQVIPQRYPFCEGEVSL